MTSLLLRKNETEKDTAAMPKVRFEHCSSDDGNGQLSGFSHNQSQEMKNVLHRRGRNLRRPMSCGSSTLPKLSIDLGGMSRI